MQSQPPLILLAGGDGGTAPNFGQAGAPRSLWIIPSSYARSDPVLRWIVPFGWYPPNLYNFTYTDLGRY